MLENVLKIFERMFLFVLDYLYICIIVVLKNNNIMSGKTTVTLSIDTDVKRAFKIETMQNDAEMSSAVEGFMENYVKLSKQLREDRTNGEE